MDSDVLCEISELCLSKAGASYSSLPPSCGQEQEVVADARTFHVNHEQESGTLQNQKTGLQNYCSDILTFRWSLEKASHGVSHTTCLI